MTDEEYELLTEKQRMLIQDVERLESKVVSLTTSVIVMQDQYAKLVPLLEKFIEKMKEETDDGWMTPVQNLQQRVRKLEAKAHD